MLFILKCSFNWMKLNILVFPDFVCFPNEIPFLESRFILTPNWMLERFYSIPHFLHQSLNESNCFLSAISTFSLEGTIWDAELGQCVVDNDGCPQDVDGDFFISVGDVLSILVYFGHDCD